MESRGEAMPTRNKRTGFGWKMTLFLPGFVIYLLIIILPIFMCLYYGFFNWDGLRDNMTFVGLDNFARALGDPYILGALKTTFFYTIPGTLIVNALGIVLAVLVNRRSRLSNFFRSAFFFPMLISAVAIGFIWKALLSYSGIINTLLASIHIEGVDFLGSMAIAPWSILLVNTWHDVGFVTVLYLAGLQAISTEYYDAAIIDGATRLQQFRYITFPWLAPSLTSCIIFVFTGYMRLYDLVFVMTSGGPAGVTETIAIQTIKVGFNQNHFSYGSALAIYMLVIIGVLSVIITKLLRKREELLIS
jgi:ABC-type sugar transport system permease subunit